MYEDERKSPSSALPASFAASWAENELEKPQNQDSEDPLAAPSQESKSGYSYGDFEEQPSSGMEAGTGSDPMDAKPSTEEAPYSSAESAGSGEFEKYSGDEESEKEKEKAPAAKQEANPHPPSSNGGWQAPVAQAPVAQKPQSPAAALSSSMADYDGYDFDSPDSQDDSPAEANKSQVLPPERSSSQGSKDSEASPAPQASKSNLPAKSPANSSSQASPKAKAQASPKAKAQTKQPPVTKDESEDESVSYADDDFDEAGSNTLQSDDEFEDASTSEEED